jgi:hypothetical protein
LEAAIASASDAASASGPAQILAHQAPQAGARPAETSACRKVGVEEQQRLFSVVEEQRGRRS